MSRERSTTVIKIPQSDAAARQIRITEDEPIKEPKAPDGEIKMYKIELYNGQEWVFFQNVTEDVLCAFGDSIDEITDNVTSEARR